MSRVPSLCDRHAFCKMQAVYKLPIGVLHNAARQWEEADQNEIGML